MKIFAYDVRDDERPYFDIAGREMGIELELHSGHLTPESLGLAAGCQGVSVLGHSDVNRLVLEKIADMGIRFLSTRTIGYNHIDVPAATEVGIRVSNSGYDPHGVAEFTVMHMLMALRHYKAAMFRGGVNDFSLAGLRGRELRKLTVGIWGNGSIASAVIDNLQGFGCRILVHGRRENPRLVGKARHVDRQRLLNESDIISLHLPLTNETRFTINDESISHMKDGVILINTARGGLMDIEALIRGIESRKIAALGLDVLEQEEGIFHHDMRTEIIANRDMAYLRQFPNVSMTPHMAFYTDQAVQSMVRMSLESLRDFHELGRSERELM